MSFQEYCHAKRIIIEQKIDQYIDQLGYRGQLKEAALYSLKAPGKRIRPLFSLLTGASLGHDEEFIYPYAIAVEFIHTYSLIHDDLPCMDDDDFRRGQPTLHKRFDEALAVLTADALLTDAFTLLLQHGQGNLRLAGGYLGQHAGAKGMVYGQVLDVTIPNAKRDLDMLRMINGHKTGALFVAAIAGSAAFCDADSRVLAGLEEFAQYLGAIFQLTDDILDIEADERELGKPLGSDAKQDKKTMATLLGSEEAARLIQSYLAKASAALGVLPRNRYTDMMQDILNHLPKRTS